MTRYRKYTAQVLAAGAAVLLMAAGASAQGLKNSQIPAEFPPATFKGKQYVDSKGCVYIRAGVNGNVTWVPRVTRQRKLICGQQPTFAKAAPKPQAPAKSAPQIKLAKPVAVPAQKPAAAPKTTRKPIQTVASIRKTPKAAAPKPRRVVKTAPASPPKAVTPVVVAKPKAPKPAPKAVKVVKAAPKAAATCKGASSLSAQYIHRNKSLPVRCGPQTEPFVTVVPREKASNVPSSNVKRVVKVRPGATATGATRVVPLHVHAKQTADGVLEVTAPAGTRPAFTDDRLNTKRAQMTLDGIAATNLVWSQTIPRKLIDVSSGRDVTLKNPRIYYPFTSVQQQRAALARAKAGEIVTVDVPVTPSISSRSVTTKRVVIQPKAKKARAVTPAPKAPKKVVKTVAKQSKPGAVSHRYVQVGTYGVPSNAQKVVQKLQGMGLPVRVSDYTRSGKTFRIVLTGPFKTQTGLSNALNAAKRAGFTDAILRK